MVNHRSFKNIAAILIVLIVVTVSTPPLTAAAPLPAPFYGYASYQFLPDSDYVQSDTKALLRIVGSGSGLPRTNVTWWNPANVYTPCFGPGGICQTTYEYAPNGVLIASTWEFYISGRGLPFGTYTAIVSSCTLTSGSLCLSWTEAFRAYFEIGSGTIQIYLPLVIR